MCHATLELSREIHDMLLDYQHADGRLRERRRHLSNPRLELIQEVSAIEKAQVVSSKRMAPGRHQGSRRRASTTKGSLALISAPRSHVVTLYVLPMALECICALGVMLCRDPRLAAQINTVIGQPDQWAELHYVQGCQISGRLRPEP